MSTASIPMPLWSMSWMPGPSDLKAARRTYPSITALVPVPNASNAVRRVKPDNVSSTGWVGPRLYGRGGLAEVDVGGCGLIVPPGIISLGFIGSPGFMFAQQSFESLAIAE